MPGRYDIHARSTHRSASELCDLETLSTIGTNRLTQGWEDPVRTPDRRGLEAIVRQSLQPFKNYKIECASTTTRLPGSLDTVFPINSPHIHIFVRFTTLDIVSLQQYHSPDLVEKRLRSVRRGCSQPVKGDAAAQPNIRLIAHVPLHLVIAGRLGTFGE